MFNIVNICGRLKRIVPSGNSAAQNATVLMAGTIAVQAITLISSPVLTRLYTPDEFGLFAIIFAIILILSNCSSGRYELAILLPKEQENAWRLCALSFMVTIVFSLLLLLCFLAYSERISEFFNHPELRLFITIIPINITFVAGSNVLMYWNHRHFRYATTTKSKLIQAVSISLISIILGFLHCGFSGLIIGLFTGQFFMFLYLLYVSQFFNKISFFDRYGILSLAIRYKKFPLFSSWAGLLNTASNQLPVFMLNNLFSSIASGNYSLANRVVGIPGSLLGSSIAQVFFHRAALIEHDQQKLRSVSLDVYTKLLLIGVLPMAILAEWGEDLFIFVFGNEWGTAGDYAGLLSLWILFVFASSPISSLFNIKERQKEFLIFNILLFVSRVLAIYIPSILGYDIFTTVFVFGAVGAIFWFGHCIYILFLSGVKPLTSIFITVIIILPVYSVVFFT